MKICGYEKFSMVDWEGRIVCTVFTVGCNFRCPFCHNASLADGSASGDLTEEVFEYLRTRKGLIDGVCISGGEPTLHAGLEDFCQETKKLGYDIKLDTNGTNPDVLERLITRGLVDYVAMDVKNSPSKYAAIVGAESLDLSDIQRSVDILKNGSVDCEFRTTLVADFHNESDIKMIALWLCGSNRYYMQKYVDREGCIEHGFSEVDKETAEKWLKLFEGKVEFVTLRGY